MMPTPDAQEVLSSFSEPVLIVQTDGVVTFSNKAAKFLFEDTDSRSLSDLSADGSDRVHSYLRRCSGSKEPTIGKMVLRDRSGAQQPYRVHGSLLRQRSDGEAALIMLRLVGTPEERFSALTKQVDDLNAEVHRRRRIQAMLEAALQERELLLRELNHRVKNNLQMLLSMLSSARASSPHPETRAVLDRACARVAAIGAAQSAFYRTGIAGVPTVEFVQQVCRTVMQTLGGDHQLELDVAAAELSSDLAAPVALMLNELMTNCVKHGLKGRQAGRIDVTFRVKGGEFELIVADNGIGFDAAEVRIGSSGLGLVRGLAEKLGGSVTFESSSGARCTIRFRDKGLRAEGSS